MLTQETRSLIAELESAYRGLAALTQALLARPDYPERLIVPPRAIVGACNNADILAELLADDAAEAVHTAAQTYAYQVQL